jgi:hypothetical protein
MSSEQIDTTKRPPIDVNDWNELVRYAQFLCGNTTNKNYKICTIDEENEEIRIENKNEFDINVKWAQDHGLKSLKIIVYIDGVHKFDGIYHIEKPKIQLSTIFPSDKLQILRSNALANKWYIPVKLDEALGICLTSAIEFAKEGKLDKNTECMDFIVTIVPEAFRKLLTTQSVYAWPREIQSGVFDMIELLVDLVGTRLHYTPVPITLLDTLAIVFDTNTTFSQKHKDEKLPSNRHYQLDDEEFLKKTAPHQKESFGWILSVLQRFIAQNGLKSLRGQFEFLNQSNGTATEYNCLLKLFVKCHQFIEARHFRLLFTRSIRQAIQFYHQMKTKNSESNETLQQLNETLIELCFNYQMNDEINEILELPSVPTHNEVPAAPLITPLEDVTIDKKSKNKDCYEQLAEEIRSLTVNNTNTGRKNNKKSRTNEQTTVTVSTRNHPTDCTTDDLLSSSEKRSLKRKHRREQHHIMKKENKRSNTTVINTYDRSDPTDILQFFAPMRKKIGALYDDLQTATCHGNLREVLKIEEKLKLLRPYSARFIADENTPDGTPMQPGQTFRKGWILLNDGSMPWCSDDIELINLADGIKVVKQPIIPVTAPHERAIITVDYVCAQEPGTYESKWILSYRHRTFGPMIWCSIEIGQTEVNKPTVEIKETFEFVDVPLPACFDLSKPYQSTSTDNSLHSSFILRRLNSIDTQSDLLTEPLQSPYFSDSDSLSAFMNSPSPILTKPNETSLIDLTPVPLTNNQEQQKSSRSSPSLEFVDTVVTNIFSVAKQAGSTAKTIFNTLQANDETIQPIQQQQQPILINTSNSNPDDLFEHIEEDEATANDSSLENDLMNVLIEMGFVDRAKNQKLLQENNYDMEKVVECLANENDENDDFFTHRN